SYGLVNLADVRGVRIEGLGGDDFLSVLLNNPWSPRSRFTGNPADDYTTFDIPVTINGGDGDDELTSESSADDLLVGGAGYDRTSAFAGNDLFSAEWMEDYSPEHQPTLGADYNTFW